MKTTPPSSPPSRNLFHTVVTVVQFGVVAAVLVWAFLLKRDLVSVEKELTALRGRSAPVASTSRETAALHERILTLESQLAAAAAMAMESKPPVATAPAPASAPANPMATLAAAMNNPAMRNLMATSQKRALETRFAELFTQLQFSPEQRIRFVELASEAQASITEAGLKLASGNLSTTEKEMLRLQVKEGEVTADAKIRDFLGDDAKYATYKQFTEQAPERTQLTALKTSLAQSGQEPLSAEQAAALTNIMYAERKTFSFTPNAGGDPNSMAVPTAEAVETRLRDQEQLNNRIADRAATVLNAEQLAGLRRTQAARQETLKASAEMARQMLGGGQAAPK
ncbi:MAG: hypothetical protein ABIZ81_08595 [Opitutaceae bacterium]